MDRVLDHFINSLQVKNKGHSRYSPIWSRIRNPVLCKEFDLISFECCRRRVELQTDVRGVLLIIWSVAERRSGAGRGKPESLATGAPDGRSSSVGDSRGAHRREVLRGVHVGGLLCPWSPRHHKALEEEGRRWGVRRRMGGGAWEDWEDGDWFRSSFSSTNPFLSIYIRYLTLFIFNQCSSYSNSPIPVLSQSTMQEFTIGIFPHQY